MLIRIDLTRMECKSELQELAAEQGIGIDLTRMECK